MENILHCDLAPRNLLVQVAGNKHIIKVADFGLSHSTKSESYIVNCIYRHPSVTDPLQLDPNFPSAGALPRCCRLTLSRSSLTSGLLVLSSGRSSSTRDPFTRSWIMVMSFNTSLREASCVVQRGCLLTRQCGT